MKKLFFSLFFFCPFFLFLGRLIREPATESAGSANDMLSEPTGTFQVKLNRFF